MNRIFQILAPMISRFLCTSLLLLAGAKMVVSQEAYSTQVSYRFVLNFTDPQTFQGNLYLGPTQSYFRYALSPESWNGEGMVADELIGDYSFTILDSATYFILSDRSAGRVLHLEQIPGARDLCLVTEDFPAINWLYSGRTKKIQDFLCFEATGAFRGRQYTVWYADELPGSFGPWKFHDLPGLVLEAFDETGEVHFYAESILSVESSNQPDYPLNDHSFEVVNRQEYVKLVKDYLERLEQRMTTRAGRGFQVTVKSSSIQSIEIYDE